MNNNISILLTYKNKILLVSTDIVEPNHRQIPVWNLIGWNSINEPQSNEDILLKIHYTTNLFLKDVHTLSVGRDTSVTYYHSRLSDSDVNLIERRNGQILQFFTVSEIKNLSMVESTANFFSRNQEEVLKLLS